MVTDLLERLPSSNEEINDKIKRQEAKVRKEKIEIVINQIKPSQIHQNKAV